MKIQLLVIFGGRSVEHEISIISAIQAINHVDKERYDVIPAYLTKEQELYVGPAVANIEEYRNIPELCKKSTLSALVREGGRVFLVEKPTSAGLRKTKRQIDVAFPIVHGSGVEDGSIQGYLRILGLPFVGCDVVSSAVGMDKHVMKTVLKDLSVPVLDCIVCSKYDYDLDAAKTVSAIEARFAYPVIVKPATLGSSIGITKAGGKAELKDALATAFSFASKVLVEPAVTNLREFNCSVVGDTEEAEASEVEEPLNAKDILSYEDKYMSGGGSKGAKTSDAQGMASLSRKVPADISPELRKTIRALAVRTFQALGCNGVSRVDFLFDADTELLYVNEINTIPGSLSFYLWEPLGIPYAKLLDRLIQLCLKREREERGLLHSFDTNVLAQCSADAFSGAKTGSKR